jgi:hypothetical protein
MLETDNVDTIASNSKQVIDLERSDIIENCLRAPHCDWPVGSVALAFGAEMSARCDIDDPSRLSYTDSG